MNIIENFKNPYCINFSDVGVSEFFYHLDILGKYDVLYLKINNQESVMMEISNPIGDSGFFMPIIKFEKDTQVRKVNGTIDVTTKRIRNL